jgi:hypothetical protein
MKARLATPSVFAGALQTMDPAQAQRLRCTGEFMGNGDAVRGELEELLRSLHRDNRPGASSVAGARTVPRHTLSRAAG